MHSRGNPMGRLNERQRRPVTAAARLCRADGRQRPVLRSLQRAITIPKHRNHQATWRGQSK